MIDRLRYYLLRHIDPFLLACLLFTCFIGLFVIYSASGQSFNKVLGQALNMLVALTMMWGMANIPPNLLERLAVPIFLIALFLLLAVALVGEVSHGARRWLNLGFVRLQPSELMKIAAPMMLAWYFARREEGLRRRDYLVAFILLLIPVALVMKQPDLGTALIIFAAGFYVIFLAGLSSRLLIAAGLLFAVLAPIFWTMLHDYQRRRVEILLDPYQDPLGAGYHTIQASIALGSGGIFGKGWLNGTQSQLDFLPERTTDFIFAVFGEEFGLIGNLFLITLFGVLIFRGYIIASRAHNIFCRLLAGSICLTFFTYVFINIGMVSGLLPVVGVPLPLISYGGTSLVTVLLGFGILMSIHSHKALVASS
jgi:rod shape determining protein RodA